LGSMIFGKLATTFAEHDYDGQRWSLFTAGVGVIVGSIAIIWLRLEAKTVENQSPPAPSIAGK